MAALKYVEDAIGYTVRNACKLHPMDLKCANDTLSGVVPRKALFCVR